MSAALQPDDPFSDASADAPWSDELIAAAIERALGRATEQVAPAQDAKLDDAKIGVESNAALARATAWLERVRAELTAADSAGRARAGDEGAAQRVAQRALAQTTRRDPPGVAGDWLVVRRFVRDSLAASPLLRLAAAVLLMQALALPILAGLLWMRAPQREGFQTRIEPPAQEPFLPAEPERPRIEFPEVDARTLPDVDAGEPQALEDTRAAEARALRAEAWPSFAGPPADVDGAPGSAARRPAWRQLLAARAHAARSEEPLRVGLSADDSQDRLVNVLRLELALDQVALETRPIPSAARPAGARTSDWTDLLTRVRADASGAGSLFDLEALALRRAVRLGLLEAAAAPRASAGEDVPGPIGPRWRAALLAVLAERGEALEPELIRWLAH